MRANAGECGLCIVITKKGNAGELWIAIQNSREMRISDAHCEPELQAGPIIYDTLVQFSGLPVPTWTTTFRIWGILMRLGIGGTFIGSADILTVKLTFQVKSKTSNDVVGASALYASHVSLDFAKK